MLLVGNTVRYLAQSAHRQGVAVSGIDAFADVDTQLVCRQHRRSVAAAPAALARAVRAIHRSGSTAWTYGAGFEAAPESLMGLAECSDGLLGNDPRVLLQLTQARHFFDLLSELEIAHPAVVFERPRNDADWLFKAAGRNGGLDVSFAGDTADADGSGYFQRFVNGPLCSLLFAADGREVQPLGFNRLLARHPVAGDFRFAGAINGLAPTESQERSMLRAARRLTRELGLRGVNGLDFVLDDGQPLLLELNARPPSTLELYESALPAGGLLCHLDACRGKLPDRISSSSSKVEGMRVVYAPCDLFVNITGWPEWVSDRPSSGTEVYRDAPLCTVHASGDDIDSVAATLRQRADEVVDLIGSLTGKVA